MILMIAPGPNITFGAMPSGATYTSDRFGLVKITNNAAVDQTALAGAGCYTLTPFGGWGAGLVDTLADLYAADAAMGLILQGQTGFPRFTAIGIYNDTANNGTWAKTGSGVGAGNWTQVSNVSLTAAVAQANGAANTATAQATAAAQSRTQADTDAAAAAGSATTAANAAGAAQGSATAAATDAAQAHTDRLNADASATIAEGLALALGPARLFPSQTAAASAVSSANPPYPNNTPILVVNANAGLDFYFTNGSSLTAAGVTLAGNTASGRAAFIAACAADGLFSSLTGAASA